MKRARRLLFGFSLLGAIGATPGVARANGAPPIHLILRDCSDIRESEVERVISAELATNAVLDDDAPDPTWIVGTCEHQRVQIEVTDAVSRKTVRRSFLLTAAAPEARSRLVGIAASELVLASWSELAQRPPLRVEPEGPRPSPERMQAAMERARKTTPTVPPQPPPRASEATATDEGEDKPERPAKRPPSLFALQPVEERRFRMMPMASVRGLPQGHLIGGGFRVGEEPLVNTSWALDTLFESGHVDNSLGRFDVQTWTLGALLYLYGRVGILTARLGAGLRAGVSVTRGEQGSTTTNAILPWGWPMLALSTSLGGQGIQFELAGEAGYVSLPIAPNDSGLSISGVWVAGQLGIGFSP